MIPSAIIGASGFIGGHLLAKYKGTCPGTVGTAFSRVRGDLVPFDLRDPDLNALSLPSETRDLLIVSAAPNIAYCEQNPEQSVALNVTGTLSLITQAIAAGLRPVFLSSDYVFSGREGAYADDAEACPSTKYGMQKYAIEACLPALTNRYLVLRLSKVYGTQKGDATLLDDFAKQLVAGKEIRAATDQIFSPTFIGDVVEAIVAVQKSGINGTVNLCAPVPWSRHGVALEMARHLGADPDLVVPVSLHDFPGMENRPLNTSLANKKLSSVYRAPFQTIAESAAILAGHWLRSDH